MSVLKKISLLIISFLVLVGFTVPPKPSGAVYDPKGYLKQSVSEKVNDANRQLATTDKKPQIAVVVVDRLNEITIEQAALQTAREWKIGFSETNIGSLIFISVKDRKIRIETSDEMATVVTDYQANQLIDAAKNDFRNEDYTSGVLKMVDGLLVTMGASMNLEIDEKLQQRVSRYMDNRSTNKQSVRTESNALQFLFGGMLFLLIILLFSRKSNRHRRRGNFVENLFWLSMLSDSTRSSRRRSRDDDDDDFFGGFGGGSSGGSSSSGWSGGGFSGGGSSGGW